MENIDYLEQSLYSYVEQALGVSPEAAIVIVSLVLLWTLIWKGIALWKSCKKNHYIWFILFLILNTLGILEILYIFLFSKIKLRKKEGKSNARKKTRSNRKKSR